MQELFIFGLAIATVICLVLTALILRLGDMIDRIPAKDEEERETSLWSPREFTRLSVAVFWPSFVIGAVMAVQPERILMIGGIVLVFGLVLFLLTEFVFSASVFNIMTSRKKEGRSSPMTGLLKGVSGKKEPFRQVRSARYGISANRK